MVAALVLAASLMSGQKQVLAGDPKPPAGPVTVATDQFFYRPGEPITATITNNGDSTIWGGGGYACGLVHIEVALSGLPGWAPAPGGAQICTAIAHSVRPGETRTETITLTNPGLYRLIVRATSDAGEQIEVYSEPVMIDFQ